MNKRTWKLYLALMSASILAGLFTVLAGFAWPVLNEQVIAAHSLNTIYVATPVELFREWLTPVMFRYWHVGYLVACACAVGAFGVALLAQREGVAL